MDKLYLLFGALTLIFLLVILGMNISDSYNSSRIQKQQKSFLEGFSGPASDIEKKIRACMDPLALNATPEGTPSTAGKDLCLLYGDIRKSMLEKVNKAGTIDPAGASKKVEETIATNVSGGPLPCPLLQYPSAGATDKEWLAWFQTVPVDFGARVIFMAMYIDDTLTPMPQQIKDALDGKSLQGFENICTPDVIAAKAKSQEAATCVMPADITPDQIGKSVDTITEQLQSTTANLLKSKISPDILGNPEKLFADTAMRVKRAKDASDFMKSQKDGADSALMKMLPSTPSSKSR